MAQTPRENNGFPMAVMVEGGLAVAAVLLAWLFGVRLRDQIPAFGRPLAEAIARGLIATVPMLAVFWWMVRSEWPALRLLREQVEWLVREMFPTASYAQFALVAALAGMGEELLFRGVVQGKLVEWTGPVVGVAIASVLFGAAHALSKLYFVLATVIGLFFGWLVIRYHELVSPIVAHAVYDFVALAYIAKLARRKPLQESVDDPPQGH